MYNQALEVEHGKINFSAHERVKRRIFGIEYSKIPLMNSCFDPLESTKSKEQLSFELHESCIFS